MSEKAPGLPKEVSKFPEKRYHRNHCGVPLFKFCNVLQRMFSMTILFAGEEFFDHETGNHPESSRRLEVLYARLKECELWDAFEHGDLEPANVEELSLIHEVEYIEQVRQFADSGGGRIESDTVVSRESYHVSSLSSGCVISAIKNVLNECHRQGICLTRPPGHHALRNAPMGFCLFNQVAVGAAYARDVLGLERMLIVDWDVHHGNGTQAAFYESGNIYYYSVHRSPFYPGTGAKDETGTGAGLGTTKNVPLQLGISREEYLKRFSEGLEEIAQRSKPQLVLISAGFDAHKDDPIGSLGLEADDFRILTKQVLQIADDYCEGKLVSVLEGGYNVDALADSVVCHLETIRDQKSGLK